MTVLVLAPSAPALPYSGGHLRQVELLRALASRHQVTLAALADEPEPPVEPLRALAEVRLFRRNVDRGAGLPALVRRHLSESLEAWLRTAEFDATIVDTVFLAVYRDLCPGLAVLHEHNIESELHRQAAERSRGSERMLEQATYLHLRSFEDQVWPKFALRTVVSQPDAERMEQRCPIGQTLVLPNGTRTDPPPGPLSDEERILFMGALNYFPNVDAVSFLVREVMPRVWEVAPRARLRIAGRQPTPGLRQLVGAEERLELVADPPDMRALARDCACSVVPLRAGSGTRLKILDAWAYGLPVVTTTLGAEGLEVADGVQVLLRDGPTALAAGLLEALRDRPLRARLAEAGWARARERHDWGRIFAPLLERLEG